MLTTYLYIVDNGIQGTEVFNLLWRLQWQRQMSSLSGLWTQLLLELLGETTPWWHHRLSHMQKTGHCSFWSGRTVKEFCIIGHSTEKIAARSCMDCRNPATPCTSEFWPFMFLDMTISSHLNLFYYIKSLNEAFDIKGKWHMGFVLHAISCTHDSSQKKITLVMNFSC